MSNSPKPFELIQGQEQSRIKCVNYISLLSLNLCSDVLRCNNVKNYLI